ncbi:hypothetical protein [Janthinobacterium fluminis]|uniref:Lipoprotein n=1 Tax=Janthinobacterium fluminis TaxID=2987524 RepID=A0ABT5JWK0_9BURK|nr:hypothetical protein [Janthinobacterium fluminis]MDC8756550.1 hypothetical protein [Janthinobacterium fluminis]
MKVLKNMEIVFTVAAALACSAAFVSVMQPQAPASASAALSAPAASSTGEYMPVVVISAKRMTPAEKKQSLIDERKQSLVAINESKA